MREAEGWERTGEVQALALLPGVDKSDMLHRIVGFPFWQFKGSMSDAT